MMNGDVGDSTGFDYKNRLLLGNKELVCEVGCVKPLTCQNGQCVKSADAIKDDQALTNENMNQMNQCFKSKNIFENNEFNFFFQELGSN